MISMVKSSTLFFWIKLFILTLFIIVSNASVSNATALDTKITVDSVDRVATTQYTVSLAYDLDDYFTVGFARAFGRLAETIVQSIRFLTRQVEVAVGYIRALSNYLFQNGLYPTSSEATYIISYSGTEWAALYTQDTGYSVVLTMQTVASNYVYTIKPIRIWVKDYYFDISTMSIMVNESLMYGFPASVLMSYFNDILDYFQAYLSLWLYNYYPRWNSGDTAAWNYYNTDTGLEEPINLGGLMYNISWYLGNLYLLNSENNYSDTANPTVTALQEKITELNNAEDELSNLTGSLTYDSSIWTEIQSIGSSITYTSNLMDSIFNQLGILQICFKLSMTVGLAVYALGSYSEVKQR